MIVFKKIEVEIPGFKYPKVFVKELSVMQLRQIQNKKFDDDIEMFLASLALCLVNEQGDKVITEDYTIDMFAEELPQSYVNTLSEAFAKLNGADEEQALDLAKNS